MGFSSMDDLITQMSTNGKTWRIDWQKQQPSTAAAGEWHFLARGAGNPTADTLYNTGTNLAFQATSDTTSGASSLYHGGNVSTATKHIVNASVFSGAANVAPGVLLLVDMLGFYRVTSVTTTGNQATNNSVTLPRYTDGAGVQAFAFVNSASSMGAATPNLSITYTNSDSVGSRTTPTVLPSCKSASTTGHIMYSGTGAGKYGPFFPLASGDKGIKQIDQINLSASYLSGEFSIGLCRVLMSMPLIYQGIASERDLVNQLPSMPRVYDGANLQWMYYSGTATPAGSNIGGHIDVAWGG